MRTMRKLFKLFLVMRRMFDPVFFLAGLPLFSVVILSGVFFERSIFYGFSVLAGIHIFLLILAGIADSCWTYYEDRFEKVFGLSHGQANKKAALMIIQDKIRSGMGRSEFYQLRNIACRFFHLSINECKWSWWVSTGIKTTFCFFLLFILIPFGLRAQSRTKSSAMAEYISRVSVTSLRPVSVSKTDIDENEQKITRLLTFVQDSVEEKAFFSIVWNGLVSEYTGFDNFDRDIKVWKDYVQKIATVQQVKFVERYFLLKYAQPGLYYEYKKYLAEECSKILKTIPWLNSNEALEMIDLLDLGNRFANVPNSEDMKVFKRAIISISKKASENRERFEKFKSAIEKKFRKPIGILDIEKVFQKIKIWEETK